MKSRVVIRADGNLNTGIGHVMRGLALAEILKEKFKCIFIVQNPDSFLRSQITAICEIIEIPGSEIDPSEAKFLSERFLLKDDIVVLDGYNFGRDYQEIIKGISRKLICIDDVLAVHFIADFIINHTEGVNPAEYKKEDYTRVYLGTDYMILRPLFLLAAQQEKFPEKGRVFISLGGSDVNNYTKDALQECLKIPEITKIDIVTGSFYFYDESLNELIKHNQSKKISVHKALDANTIVYLMRKSSIGICSASSVAYEYCCAGNALVMYQTAKNQQRLYSFLSNESIGFQISDLPDIVRKFKEPNNFKEYTKNKRRFFNGSSCKRILKLFSSIEIERHVILRKTTDLDMKDYYDLANDPDVRSNSINQDPIRFEDHVKWFKSKLRSPDHFFYTLEFDKQFAGQLRFEKKENEVIVSYALMPEFRGKGLGEIILKKGIFELRKTLLYEIQVLAWVKNSNTASFVIFQKSGFSLLRKERIENREFSIFQRQIEKTMK